MLWSTLLLLFVTNKRRLNHFWHSTAVNLSWILVQLWRTVIKAHFLTNGGGCGGGMRGNRCAKVQCDISDINISVWMIRWIVNRFWHHGRKTENEQNSNVSKENKIRQHRDFFLPSLPTSATGQFQTRKLFCKLLWVFITDCLSNHLLSCQDSSAGVSQIWWCELLFTFLTLQWHLMFN